MGLFNKPSYEAGSFSFGLNPQRFFQSGFEALFLHTGTLGCTVCLTPQLFLLVYLHRNVGPHALPASSSPVLVLQLPPCFESFPPWLPISSPPSGLDKCVFFNSLVVGLPFSSILWQFWLFFVLKFVILILLVVQVGKVNLPMPPFWSEVHFSKFFVVKKILVTVLCMYNVYIIYNILIYKHLYDKN